jgi:hypothetical protein
VGGRAGLFLICYISGLAGITGFHALVSFILHLLGGEAIDDGFAQTFAVLEGMLQAIGYWLRNEQRD